MIGKRKGQLQRWEVEIGLGALFSFKVYGFCQETKKSSDKNINAEMRGRGEGEEKRKDNTKTERR